MLFLLNKSIIEVDAPELHLARNWKRIGCGDPATLFASDAVNFAIMVVNSHATDNLAIDPQTATDLAALIISKTGANAALFPGENNAKLNVLPEVVLQGLQKELGTGTSEPAERFWIDAA